MHTRPKPLSLACRSALASLTGIASLMLLPVAPVHAQGGQLEEVIVTSNYREENLQDIPVAVTAFSGDELNEAQLFGQAEIAYKTPGMTYAEFAPGQAIVSMRGISSPLDGAGVDNSVVMFLDGVYVGSIAAIQQEMFDVERIEVLRGPQGTLFGRNAIGGAINVISMKPSQETVVRANATVGNEGTLAYQGMVAGGLTDTLSGKLVYNHREHDGYVDNIILGIDQQDEDVSSVRGQLRWETDQMDWILSADYMEDEREDMGRFPRYGNDGNPNGTRATYEAWGGGDRRVAAPAGVRGEGGGSEREASGVSLTGNISFDAGTLTSITGFRNAKTDWGMASVGTGIPVEIIDDIEQDIDTFTQELRWTSDLGGRFNYVAGLFYLNEENDREEEFRLLIPLDTNGGTFVDPATQDWGQAVDIGNEVTRQINETTSYAAYFQGDYDVSDALTLTVGVRYTRDEKDNRSISVNCGSDAGQANYPQYCSGVGGSLGIIANTFDIEASESWDDVSPMVSLNYTPSDGLMLYGKVAYGFKSGGFGEAPGSPQAAVTPVAPEEAVNYEVGMKGDFLDQTLRLNVAAFYMDYEDLQIVRFGPTAENPDFGQFVTANIGTADIYGAEIEFTWAPTENFQLRGNYAYLDTTINDLFINGVDPTDLPGNDDQLRQAPENSYNLTAVYDMPLGGAGNLRFRADYVHVDEQVNDYIVQDTTIDEVDLIDGRIAWSTDGGEWEIAAWGKNLTDELYVSHSYTIGPGVIGIYGPPRTYGLSVTYQM